MMYVVTSQHICNLLEVRDAALYVMTQAMPVGRHSLARNCKTTLTALAMHALVPTGVKRSAVHCYICMRRSPLEYM